MNENPWNSRWSKDQIKAMLIEQFDSFWTRDTGTERTQLDEIESAANVPHAVIVSGLRRVGKSTLLAQMAHKLGRDAFYYVNFEDDRFLGFQPEDANHLYQALVETFGEDYLLKPVGEARLKKAVERARSLLGRPIEIANQVASIASVNTPASPVRHRKVVGRSGADFILLDADEVLAFQAERELVWIVTSKQRLLGTQSLRAIEDRLGGPQFQRVHRNAIVNVNHVRKLSALSSQRWSITLSNSLQLVVSKRQAHKIRQILQW